MRILICDNVAETAAQIFKDDGFDVEQTGPLSEEEISEKIKGIHGLVVRSGTTITPKVLKHATNLKVIGRAGVGVDNINIEAATKSGIVVMNTPLGNVNAAAELTVALVMAIARKIPMGDHLMKQGTWNKKKLVGIELKNKTLGIIGLGHVGEIVARRANGLAMNVIGYDPFILDQQAKSLNVQLVKLDECISMCDILTIHTPLNEKTRNLINEEKIALMKDGAYLINVGRGGLVDELALLSAIQSNKLAGAAIDVWAKEPDIENQLINEPNVIALPHIGASTREAQEDVAVDVARQIIKGLNSGRFENALNFPFQMTEDAQNYLPYFQFSEKLGKLGLHLVDNKIQKVHIEHSGNVSSYGDALEAYALKGILLPMYEDVNVVNAPYLASHRGITVTNTKTKSVNSDFSNYIRVTLETKTDKTTLGGTIFGNKYPRVIELNDYFMEAKPEGNTLVLENEDIPGVVGQVGTLLGQHNINVSEFRLAKKQDSPNALAFINVEGDIAPEVLTALQQLPVLKWIKHICF